MKAGWVTNKLDDVTTKIGSGATPLGGAEAYKAKGISLIRSLNVYDEGFRKAKLAHIDDEQADGLSNVVVEPHDVLLNITGASIARCCLAPADSLPARVNQHVSIIRPIKEKLDSVFLHYLLVSKTYKERLLRTGEEGGSTRQAITRAQLQEFVVAYPESLLEQRRIVGILNEAFERFATATANAETNLHNARALFESHLQSVFTQRGKGWMETTLEEVVDANCTLSYGIVQPGNDYTNGLPVVRPTDLTAKVITLDGLKRIDPKLAEGYRRTTLRGEELLLCVRGSTGVVSMTSPDLAGANVTRGIVPIVFNTSILRHDFGYFLMTSVAVQSQIRAKTYGAALMQINIGDLRKIAVAFPEVKQQQDLADRLQALFTETQRLEAIYQRKLAALDELKQSLLHQAFTGAL